jgi:glycosyltransferase involved in cell wall biosynthesis
MRVLFLHPNFPAQFRHVAQALAAAGHDVAFLCQTHFGRQLPGVKRLCMKGNLSHEALLSSGGNQLQRAQRCAKQYRRAMAKLDGDGWRPEVVISHSGWGCGLHVKELWPHCRHVSYLEWWFDPESELLRHDPGNQALGLTPALAPSFWLRNQTMALELICADAVVAPTQWQRAQLPAALKARCQVIHDGINLQQFQPRPEQRAPKPLLTYGTRGMEPMRGFPELIRELPAALQAWPELEVEIAGEDEIHYGGTAPAEGTWKTWAERRLTREVQAGRVRWRGRLATEEYVQWLQSSWMHVYLTQPYVASWSLVEALACGCPLVASDVAPVREFCAPGRAWLVDSRQPGFLQAPLLELKRRTESGSTLDMMGEPIALALSREHAVASWLAVVKLCAGSGTAHTSLTGF